MEPTNFLHPLRHPNRTPALRWSIHAATRRGAGGNRTRTVGEMPLRRSLQPIRLSTSTRDFSRKLDRNRATGVNPPAASQPRTRTPSEPKFFRHGQLSLEVTRPVEPCHASSSRDGHPLFTPEPTTSPPPLRARYLLQPRPYQAASSEIRMPFSSTATLRRARSRRSTDSSLHPFRGLFSFRPSAPARASSLRSPSQWSLDASPSRVPCRARRLVVHLRKRRVALRQSMFLPDVRFHEHTHEASIPSREAGQPLDPMTRPRRPFRSHPDESAESTSPRGSPPRVR